MLSSYLRLGQVNDCRTFYSCAPFGLKVSDWSPSQRKLKAAGRCEDIEREWFCAL
jgi:hypothetical protein